MRHHPQHLDCEEGECTRSKKNRKYVILAAVALFIAVCAVVQFTELASWHQIAQATGVSDFTAPAKDFPLSIHFIDVKKADAILIQCEGYNMLIDGGTPDCASMITEYLARQDVDELELVIATHPDRDHIGGLAGIIREIKVKQVLMPEIPESTDIEIPEYVQFMEALREKELSPEHPGTGDVYTVGGLSVEILAPLRQYTETNNNSIIAKLRYGERQYLFTGDAEEKAEKDLLESGIDLRADVLKIAHHGSKSGTSEAFLLAVDPTYAVISSGRDRNKLPSRVVLERLEKYGIPYSRTDYDGTVILVSDGREISFIT